MWLAENLLPLLIQNTIARQSLILKFIFAQKISDCGNSKGIKRTASSLL